MLDKWVAKIFVVTIFHPPFLKLIVTQDDVNTALRNQRQLLEEEKRLALDLLREEVLQMEERHRKAFQEIQDLHEAEIRKNKEEYSRELEEELGKLKAQHEREQEVRMLLLPKQKQSMFYHKTKLNSVLLSLEIRLYI